MTHKLTLSLQNQVALITGAGSGLGQLSAWRLAAAGVPHRNELDEHRDILNASIDGKLDEVGRLLREHYGKTAEIILTDIDGQVLLSQDTEGKKAFAKVFNLSELPSGDYFLTVRTSLRETVQPIALTKTEVLVYPERKREFYSPVIRVEKQHVDVSLFNGRIGNVTVNILDNNNAQVFQEKLENVLVVEKRYNLNQLPWGRYTIEVVTESNTYYKAFSVR